MLNQYSENYLVSFVRDLISDTKQGDLEWTVDYDLKNNRHLKICTADDRQMKITGVYDKHELEKVSLFIAKSITINEKNINLLNKFRDLISLIEERYNFKLDIPEEISDYIRGYYEKTNKISNIKQPNNSKNKNNQNSQKSQIKDTNTSSKEEKKEDYEIVEESGIPVKVKK